MPVLFSISWLRAACICSGVCEKIDSQLLRMESGENRSISASIFASTSAMSFACNG